MFSARWRKARGYKRWKVSTPVSSPVYTQPSAAASQQPAGSCSVDIAPVLLPTLHLDTSDTTSDWYWCEIKVMRFLLFKAIKAISTLDMFCPSLYSECATTKVWSHILMVYISPAVRWRQWSVSSQGKLQPGPRLQARFSHFFADERIGEQLSSVALPSLLELETKDKRRIARISQSWRLKVPTSAFTFKTLLWHYAKQTLTHGK